MSVNDLKYERRAKRKKGKKEDGSGKEEKGRERKERKKEGEVRKQTNNSGPLPSLLCCSNKLKTSDLQAKRKHRLPNDWRMLLLLLSFIEVEAILAC